MKFDIYIVTQLHPSDEWYGFDFAQKALTGKIVIAWDIRKSPTDGWLQCSWCFPGGNPTEFRRRFFTCVKLLKPPPLSELDKALGINYELQSKCNKEPIL